MGKAANLSGKNGLPHKKSSGFTLIEVLLTMSIVFLVAMATFQGYQTAQDSAARATHALLSVGDQQTLLSHIRVSVCKGRQQGDVAIRDLQFHWKSEPGEPQQTVLGFDPQTLRPELSGRSVLKYRVRTGADLIEGEGVVVYCSLVD